MKNRIFSRLSLNSPRQDGINVVDLMMWLSIAALILATALQGSGYYRTSTYVHHMKSVVLDAANRITSNILTSGNIYEEDVKSVVNAENEYTPDDDMEIFVDKVTSEASEPASAQGAFELASGTTTNTPINNTYLRVTHEEVASYDVVYFFKDVSGYKSGLHVVPKGSLTNIAEEPTEEPSAPVSPTDAYTPSPSPTPTSSPTATSTPTPTTTTAPSPTATATPSPTASTPPEDYIDVQAEIAASADPGYNALWTNRTILTGHADVNFAFQIIGATSHDNYVVEWTGGATVNAAPESAVGARATSGSEKIWVVSVDPKTAMGFSAGTGKISVKATNKSTGASSYKTWTLTVVEGNPINPAGYSPYDTYYSDRTVTTGTADVNFAFSIGNNAAFADYNVVWTGGTLLNATPIFGKTVSSPNGERIWYAEVVPKTGGFPVGTDTITATVTTKSGKTFTKVWNLKVDSGMPSKAFPIAPYSNQYLDTKIGTGTTTPQTFRFTIPDSDYSDYTVAWSGSGLNIVNITGGTETLNGSNTWYGKVTPGVGGFLAGKTTITAKVTTKSGAVFTETFVITVELIKGVL